MNGAAQVTRQLERVRVRVTRRIPKGAKDVRWRSEKLTGTIIQRVNDRVRVQFDPWKDGKRRDGSARGCTLWVNEADCEPITEAR